MKTTFPEVEIQNNLAEVRKQRGWPASRLAEAAGVSRQAIYSIEAGTYVPNTALSLRLAQILEVRIDELFRLKGTPRAMAAASAKADLITGGPLLREGQAVQLGRVDGRLLAVQPAPPEWYLPASDGTADSRPVAGRVNVRLPEADLDFDNRLIIAGCDPAASILAPHLQAFGIRLVLIHRNSSESLSLLKKRQVHLAGTHLWHASVGEANASSITGSLRRNDMAAFSFAQWQEGLVAAPRNPKRIRKVEDLSRKGVRFVNRELGAGTRLLLDTALARVDMKPSDIRGYRDEAPGHLAAALQVNSGGVDCCIATEASARAFGLSFVPLDTARYDFVLRRDDLELSAVRILFDVLNRAAFRRELSACTGYDTSGSGASVL